VEEGRKRKHLYKRKTLKSKGPASNCIVPEAACHKN
jgi:hypothetical protein